MPIVTIKRDSLFTNLGRTYTEDEFQLLCFEFGIELDEVTSEKKMAENAQKDSTGLSTEELYKIDIPANRYDLLCEEGIVRALLIFQGKVGIPDFKLAKKEPVKMYVAADTAKVRPIVVGAILRDLTFNEHTMQSFIDLQDKLHFNICRRRTLVAIGTHDLDTLVPPFRYEARKPEDISFIPLTQSKEFRADELIKFYETDPSVKHIKPYVPIIKDSPVYPVIYDSKRTVLSLPPLINGEHSKIRTETKNVFIECTATDRTKAIIVLNMMITMFSEYCKDPFTIDPVEVIFEESSKSEITPDLSTKEFNCTMNYVNSRIGIDIPVQKAAELLGKMQLKATVEDKDSLKVVVPPTRADVLHPCDIMEDIGIAYGYNNIEKTYPKSQTVGREDPLNQFTDLLRNEFAQAGYTEYLTLALVSEKDNFEKMCLKNEGQGVKTSNPKTSEFQNCRISLIPGLLKSLKINLKAGLPLKLFEVSDVVLTDSESDTGCRNVRYATCLYCNVTSGFEIIHGMLDRIMTKLGFPFSTDGYQLKESDHPSYLKGRHAEVVIKGVSVGHMGILSPIVLQNFKKIKFPVSVLEVDAEKVQDLMN